MNRFFSLPKLLFFVLPLLAASPLFAQNPPIEQSYEVILQAVVGGDQGIKGQPLPANLSSISRQLKTTYGFPEVRLVNTYVGRIANGGNYEFKSVSNSFGHGLSSDTPSFLDWSVAGLRSGKTAAGKDELMIQNFRFGARIPIRVGGVPADPKQPPIINYESVGLTSARVTLAENTPTMLGSLSLPGGENSMFLVLTIRPA